MISIRNFIIAADTGQFRRTVQVHVLDIRQCCQPFMQLFGREYLSNKENFLQCFRKYFLECIHLGYNSKGCRYPAYIRNFAFIHVLDQSNRENKHLRRKYFQCSTGIHHEIEILGRGIKEKWCLIADDLIGAKVKITGIGHNKTDHSPMAFENTFWFAGGTGCVNHISR